MIKFQSLVEKRRLWRKKNQNYNQKFIFKLNFAGIQVFDWKVFTPLKIWAPSLGLFQPEDPSRKPSIGVNSMWFHLLKTNCLAALVISLPYCVSKSLEFMLYCLFCFCISWLSLFLSYFSPWDNMILAVETMSCIQFFKTCSSLNMLSRLEKSSVLPSSSS